MNFEFNNSNKRQNLFLLSSLKGAGEEMVNMTQVNAELKKPLSLEIMAALSVICMDELQLKLH